MNAWKNANALYMKLTFPVLFLVHSLRAETVGWDTDNYVKAFRYYLDPDKASKAEDWEAFFRFLYGSLTRVTEDPQWILVVCAAIILTGYAIFIYYNTDEGCSVFWPVFFYLTLTHYFSSMNILRQCCAMAFSLNIITVLRRDRSQRGFLIAALLLVLSTMFHSTAVIGAVYFVPFIPKKTGRGMVGLVFLFTLIGYFSFSKLLLWLFQVFPKYAHYEESKYFAEAGIGPYYTIQMLLKIFLIFMVLFLNPDDENNTDTYRLTVLVAVSVGITLLKSETNLAARLSFFFDLFNILAIPMAVNRLCEGKVRTLVYHGLFALGVFMLFYNMTGSSKGCVPYEFFWQISGGVT